MVVLLSLLMVEKAPVVLPAALTSSIIAIVDAFIKSN